ncbi:MAG: phage portal protein [Thermoguttaceae bacterium]
MGRYRLDEEDQCRGVPWFASSLDTTAQIRDWDKAMLDAAEQLAKAGIVWQLKNPEGNVATVRGSAPMERGMQTFGPSGYEPEQIPPTQPSADQQSWRAEKKSEVGRGINMPAMIINLDSAKHSYSSARFDNQPYWRSVGAVQGWLARIGLDRMEEVVIREAELAGELEEAPEDAEHSWGWIKPPHVDPTKEFLAERGYMQNGTLPWSDAVIAHGQDPDRVREMRKRDAEHLVADGLPAIPGIPDPSKAAGSGASGPPGNGSTKNTNDTNGQAGATGSASAARGLPVNGRFRADDGHWVTIDGNHVLIKDQSPESSAAEAKSAKPVLINPFGHTSSHNIALPKNSKRLTIDQAHQAMAKMGYTPAEIKGMSPSEIKDKVYAGAKIPGQIGAAKRNSVERSLPAEDHGREAARTLPGDSFRDSD